MNSSLIDFFTEVIGITHSLLVDILFFHWLKREQVLYWLWAGQKAAISSRSSSAWRNKNGCICYSPAASYTVSPSAVVIPLSLIPLYLSLTGPLCLGSDYFYQSVDGGSYSLSFSCVDFFQFRFHVTHSSYSSFSKSFMQFRRYSWDFFFFFLYHIGLLM